MTIEFIVIQMIGVLIEVLVTYTYFESLLGTKDRKHIFKSKIIWLYVAMFIFLSIMNCLISNLFITPACLFVSIFIISIFYFGEWKNKISLSVLLTIIFVLSEMVVGMILSMISARSVDEITNNPLLYFQGVFISKMVTFIIVKIICIFKGKHHYALSLKTWMGIMSIPIASIISVFAVVEVAYNMKDSKSNMLVMLIAFCLIISNIIAFYIFENELKLGEERLKYSFLEKQLNDEKEYYKSMADVQLEIKKTAHDMKNTMISILGCISDGKTEIAEEKLREMINVSKQDAQNVYTGQIVVDTMLNMKYKRMKENNIEFKPVCIMSAGTEFDEIDFCILIGNALDNAIEACEKIEDEKKYIILHIVEKEEYIFCYMENSTNGYALKEGEKTTKKDKQNHGFGMDNMRSIVRKNGGSIESKHEDNKFILSISFKI